MQIPTNNCCNEQILYLDVELDCNKQSVLVDANKRRDADVLWDSPNK